MRVYVLFFSRLLKYLGGDALARQIWRKNRSLHAVNEGFFAKFNATSASKVVFQQAVRARLKAVINIGATLALMVVAQAGAEELTPNVFSIALKSLQAPATTSFSQFHNKSLVVSFFEPDCPWCYRQILMLNELQQRCSDQLQVVLIGTQGTRQQLQSELRRSKTLLPAFASSSALLQLTGPINATPVTFIFNGQGVKVAGLKGFAPQSAILDGICRAQVVP